MDTNREKAAQGPFRRNLRQSFDLHALGNAAMNWLVPALFALLVSATIRSHSLNPMATMARTVGNLLAVVSLALLLLLWRGRRLELTPRVAVLLSALGASAAVSVLGSGGADHSLLRLELYFAVALLATAVFLGYRDRNELPLEACFLSIALVHLPFLVSAILWIKDLDPPFWQDSVRVAHFGHVRQFGEFGFLAAASATALGLISRRFVVLSFLLAACAVFGIVLTGCRGALLSWMLFVLLAIAFTQARVRVAVHGVLVLAPSASLVWHLDRSGILPSPNIFSRLAEQPFGEAGFSSGRLRVWGESLEQIVARPLFGSGPEGFWISGCCERFILQAHNFVLQFLMEFGVIGCGLVALLASCAVKGMGGLAGTRQLLFASSGNRVLACLLVAFLAYSLIDQMLYHLVPLVHFGFFVGLFAAGLAQARVTRDQ